MVAVTEAETATWMGGAVPGKREPRAGDDLRVGEDGAEGTSEGGAEGGEGLLLGHCCCSRSRGEGEWGARVSEM